MDQKRLATLAPQFEQYLDEVTADIRRTDHRKWSGAYIRGLLLDGDRKSIAPMAKRVRDIDDEEGDYEQSLQQFISDGVWDDDAVRQRIRSWIVERVGRKGTLVLCHTSFAKKGDGSVGVAPQYDPLTGRRGNRQIVTMLHYAVADKVFCIDAVLRLPPLWLNDLERCKGAGVPVEAMRLQHAELEHQLFARHATSFSGNVVAAVHSMQAILEWLHRGGVIAFAYRFVVTQDYSIRKMTRI